MPPGSGDTIEALRAIAARFPSEASARSADFQSAASPTFSRQDAPGGGALRNLERPADCKSATQQSPTPRYFGCGCAVTPPELITGILTPAGIFKPEELWAKRLLLGGPE